MQMPGWLPHCKLGLVLPIPQLCHPNLTPGQVQSWSPPPHPGMYKIIGQDVMAALPAPALTLVDVQAPPWVPSPQVALGLALSRVHIRMQTWLPGNLEMKATGLDCHQEMACAGPPSSSSS